MRVAVVDIGSNSTRLLIADLGDDGSITEVERESVVTRLGEGVDTSGRLADAAIERVYAVLTDYRRRIDDAGAPTTVGVLTSATRDAANGEEFTRTVRERFGIAARAIPGEEEARLTYLGATSTEDSDEPTVVIDIGGGSTEFVIGAGDKLLFHTSTQVGVVRHTERHLHDDPPTADQLPALRQDAAETFAAELPSGHPAQRAIAVAGTATQTAAILETTTLERQALEDLLQRLASVPLERRRATPGLDPARAPTIVAGLAILLEGLRALGLHAAEASDHDILRGAALQHTDFAQPDT